jgi:hypothetical protein
MKTKLAIVAALVIIAAASLEIQGAMAKENETNTNGQRSIFLDPTILGAIIAGFFTLLAAVLGVVIKSRKDIGSKVDTVKDILVKNRMMAYAGLWERLKPLAIHSQVKITFGSLEDLLNDLQDWYYGIGGLVLSRESQQAYVNLLDEIRKAVSNKIQENFIVDAVTVDSIKKMASTLRTQTANDAGTR